MKSPWIAAISLTSSIGLVGASLTFAFQGSAPGKGGGGNGGGGNGGGGGGATCTVVESAPVNVFNPNGPTLFGPDFGRPLAVASLGADEFLVVTTSNDNMDIVQFTFDSLTGAINHDASATVTVTGTDLGQAHRLALGDIDGDEALDIVAGDPMAGGSGAVHVFLSTGGSLGLAPPSSAEFFGISLAVGDMNNNGNAEVALGAPAQAAGSGIGMGQVFVFEYDANAAAFIQVPGSPLSTGELGDAFGAFVGVAKYTNNSTPNLIVGAPNKDNGRAKDAGVTFVYESPNDGSPLELIGKKGEGLAFRLAADMVLQSDSYNDLLAVNALSARTRRAVIFESPLGGNPLGELELPIDSNHDGGYGRASAGDMNNDNLADIVIGAPDAFDSNGAVYVYASGNGVPAAECAILRSPNLDPSAVDFGWTVAAIPGSPYFLVGEPYQDGQIYVFDVMDVLAELP